MPRAGKGYYVLHRFLPSFAFALVCIAQTPPGPLTVQDAVREAIDKNLSLLAERHNVSIADARIIQARLKPNPVLSLGLDYQDFLREGFTLSGNQGPPEWNARVDFVLERGGKRAYRVEVAENAKAVAQLQLLNTIRQLVIDVENAFVDVQAAGESVALSKENLRSLNDVVAINTNRVRAGDLSQLELIRSRLAALQFRNSVGQAELKLATAKSRLALLVGHPAWAQALEVQGDIRRDTGVVATGTLQTAAFQMRPDLQALAKDQARSQADLKLQIAQSKVDYTVGAEYHRQYDIVHADAIGVFFSAPIPVFNRNQGEIERARREDKQIETRILALQASIASELDTAYLQYATSRGLLENIEKTMLQEAREVRRITEYSYRRGEASLLEFLDAARAFNDTMQSYNDARADFARSLYLLDSVSGKAVTP